MGRHRTLTLAVIVKNEAQLLARLLAHHRDLVDEMVVVDTGSRDQSVAVARAAGAEVAHFAWCDDFSAARNFSLDMASGDSILCLDCDELISKSDFPEVRNLADAAGRGMAWILPQRNYSTLRSHSDWEPVAHEDLELTQGAPGFIPAYSIRIFPNHDGLRYQGIIHETLEPGARRLGLRQHQADVPVHHHGHLFQDKQENRKRLYGRLLRRKIQRQPADSRARFELAVQLVEEGRCDLAERLLVRTVVEAPGSPEVHRARLLLGRLLLNRREETAALKQFERALQERPDWRPAWAETVQANLLARRDTDAQRFLDRGLQLFPQDPRLRRLAAQVFPSRADKKRVAENQPGDA